MADPFHGPSSHAHDDDRRRILATWAAMAALVVIGAVVFVIFRALWLQQREAACVEARHRNCAPVDAPDQRPVEPIRLPGH